MVPHPPLAAPLPLSAVPLPSPAVPLPVSQLLRGGEPIAAFSSAVAASDAAAIKPPPFVAPPDARRLSDPWSTEPQRSWGSIGERASLGGGGAEAAPWIPARPAREEPPALGRAPAPPDSEPSGGPGSSDTSPHALASPPALGGVLAASNAAFAAQERPPSPLTSPEPVAGAVANAAVALELIWFAPVVAPRLRRHPGFLPWTRRQPAPPIPPVENAASPAAPASPPASAAPLPEPPLVEDVAAFDVHTVLTMGPLTRGRDLEALAGRAVEENRPLPPLVLIEGELELPFAEAELLKAVIATASPVAVTDKKLKEVLDVAVETMKTPLHAIPEIASGLIARVREAWSKANRGLPASTLDAYVDRLLLEARSYQKRDLLDSSWIRALILVPGQEGPIPAYLPWEISKKLPLFKRFPARMLAEVFLQQDQHEVVPFALVVGALARTGSRTRFRGR